ncbi:MAG: hypothetical protein ACRD38_00375, partial [Nitrososphaerales archaeon]
MLLKNALYRFQIKLVAVVLGVLLLSSTLSLGSIAPKPAYGQLSSLTDEELVAEVQASVSRLGKITGVLDEAAAVDVLNHRIMQLRNEVGQLVSDGELKPNLRNHLDAIFPTLDNAHNFVLNSDEMGANNMINTVNNKIMAFINMVEAERGKKISVELADQLISEATEISQISQKRGRDLTPFVQGIELPITAEVIAMADAEYSVLQGIIAEVQSRGIQIDVVVEQNSPGVASLIILGIRISLSAISAYTTTNAVNEELQARGLPPLSTEEWYGLYALNFTIYFGLSLLVGPIVERDILMNAGRLVANQIPRIQLLELFFGHFTVDVLLQHLVLVPAEIDLIIHIRQIMFEAHLTVIKDVLNDDGGILEAGDFIIHVSGTNVSPADFAAVSFPGLTITLDPGSYSVTEDPVLGYSSTFSDDCTGTITSGVTKVCIIVNRDEPDTATLTVIKQVINDDTGTKQVSDFPLFIDGQPVTSGVPNTISAGEHLISETQQSGYSATIGGDCAPNGSIQLQLGENKTCTIINNDQALTALDVIWYGASSASGNPPTDDGVVRLQNSGHNVEKRNRPLSGLADATLVVITAQGQNQFTTAEVTELTNYVNNGGRVIFAVDTDYFHCNPDTLCAMEVARNFGFGFDGDLQGGTITPEAGQASHPVWTTPNALSSFSNWCCDAYVRDIFD